MAMDTSPFSPKTHFTPNNHDVFTARRNFVRPVRGRLKHLRLSRHDDGLQIVAKTYTSVCILVINSSYWESPYQFTIGKVPINSLLGKSLSIHYWESPYQFTIGKVPINSQT